MHNNINCGKSKLRPFLVRINMVHGNVLIDAKAYLEKINKNRCKDYKLIIDNIISAALEQ